MAISIPAAISDQLTPNGVKPYVNQQNFGQMIGEVSSYGTHVPIPIVQNFINNAARAYYDRRNWYGLMTRGQIQTPGYYHTGTVSLTRGSKTVTGTNTSWTASLSGIPIIGQQFRLNFTAPIYTITGVDVNAQTLTLDMPWGMPDVSDISYYITKYYYSFPNIKYFISVKNLQMMYRMLTNVSQSLIENWDPSRLQMMYPRVVSTMPPDSSGNYQVELWPVPNTPQAFPYLGYVQPPNLVRDADNLPPYIRCDVVKSRAIASVLLYRPKQNPGYSEASCIQIATEMNRVWELELASAAQADENLYRQNVVNWIEQAPMVSMDMMTGQMIYGGATMSAMRPEMAEY